MLKHLRCSLTAMALCLMTYAGEAMGCSHQLPIPAAELDAIAVWTAEEMGVANYAPFPCARAVSAAELSKYGSKTHTLEAGVTNVVAVYSPSDHVILISQDQNVSGTSGLSVLVHEMVHHLQFQSGHRFECIAQMEVQALTVQEAFPVERGTSLEREFGIDPFSRLVAGLCQR